MTQRFKLGRLPKQRPEGLKALHEYGTLPPAPQSFGIAAEEAFAWGMLGTTSSATASSPASSMATRP